MSKRSAAKENQEFLKKGAPICANCKHFTSVKTPNKWRSTYFVERMLRCSLDLPGLGNFKVGKSSWCKYHEFKPVQ